MGLNRKRLKKKKRSCPLCKPNKTGGALRWKDKEFGQMKADNNEIVKGLRAG
ncbi:MAG: hypothetical protein ACLQDH_02040 [Dissulfurispiraceae bacterium]